MPQTLAQLCKPRQSVFDTTRQDTVLSIKNLLQDDIDPGLFFSENFITEGMRTLLDQGFNRLEGKSEQGIFLLKQAMGGGKTHNLLTFGLLAKHPQHRHQFMGSFHPTEPSLGPVKVVAFNGREANYPLGLWGAIAEQLGKREVFADLYSPLRAPGQSAWENLLAGENVLILIDELPPYLFNGTSISIGNSNLAEVTTTAISNLLVAINSDRCKRVCLVLTDLTASYDVEVARINNVLTILTNETNRSAQPLEPVNMGSDELYHILRKRIFENLPNESEIAEVAQAYAATIRAARQMDITADSPEQFAVRVQASYPFHPAIRDLYARFKENPGFQQTRGLIRLMRNIVARMYTNNEAGSRYLIATHDLDFNDPATRAELVQINNTLGNAIAHDIASDGNSVAEQMDKTYNNSDATDVCRLILMSSLSNVENGVIGLTLSEVITNLAEPGRDLQHLRSTILERLTTLAWYLHSDRDGKLFFKNTENLVARIESLVSAYAPEQAIKELRERLKTLFNPTKSWAYQKLQILPALDEIELEQDKVTLVILEPRPGGGIHPDVLTKFQNDTYKNRVGFLTGSAVTHGVLIDNGKRLRAIASVLEDYRTQHMSDNDPLLVAARDMDDKYRSNFYSSVRETFTTLLYPADDNGPILEKADITMQFESNRYDGEQQIIDLLKNKGKFEENISSETFRKKIEQRLFTQQNMQWSEIKRRAAIFTKWQWHIPSALDSMRTESLQRDIWRENGGYVDKGPFAKPKTSVSVRVVDRDINTGETRIQITPINADRVHYEFGAAASLASQQLDGQTLLTAKMKISLLAVDSRGEHETGDPVEWQNSITLKHRFFQDGAAIRCELQSAPPVGSIRYSTDGSNPNVSGAYYESPFVVPAGASLVLANAEAEGIFSEIYRLNPPALPAPAPGTGGGTGTTHPPQQLTITPDPGKPAAWQRAIAKDTTQASYTFLEQAKRYQAELSDLSVLIQSAGGVSEWLELSFEPRMKFSAETILGLLPTLQALHPNGQVNLRVNKLYFPLGKDLTDLVAEMHAIIQLGELEQ